MSTTEVSTVAPVGWDRTAQPAIAAAMQSGVEHDELGHAFLLVGPAGVGQREVARALAASLNCPEVAAGRPCGACETCRRIGRDTHSVLVTFEPEGAQHHVDAVRQWIRTASRTLTEGRRRLIRIVAADRMNESTQNAFLKALEEPAPTTVWLLEATNDTALLDTILSRCRRLDLVTWPPEALRERGRELGIPDGELEAAVRSATGSPDRLAVLGGRECPECQRVHPVGPSGHAPRQCLHHPLTCTACGRKDVKGPPKLGGGRKPPCDCAKGDFDPDGSTLVGVETVLDRARHRHVDVVRRLTEQGPGGVPEVLGEVAAWAKRCAAGLEEALKEEEQHLCEDYGVDAAEDLPKGIRPRMKKRHDRLKREATLAAWHRFLDEFGSWVRDVLLVHGGGEDRDLVNLDHAADARRDAGRLPVEACLRALTDLNWCRNAITEFNGAPELQVERVLHPLAAALFASGRR